MKSFLLKYKVQIAIAIAFLVGGFFLGRATITTKTSTKWVKLETIHYVIPSEDLKPTSEVTPVHPDLPMIHDTVRIAGKPVDVVKTDTAKIIAEYVVRRTYNPMFVDKNTGMSFKINAEVQYNKLDVLTGDFQPVEKQTTVYKQKLITPYARLGYNTMKYLSIGGGIYVKNLGVEVNVMQNVNTNERAFEVGVVHKFE